tara:strand:+ start:391 stop:654 length:264 start_codon:yes stop_codon:yes gene_type:complete
METIKARTCHATMEVRAARLAWNTLLTLSKNGNLDSKEFYMVIATMREMNREGLFEKQGEVLEGPIQGDFGGIPFSRDMLPPIEVRD